MPKDNESFEPLNADVEIAIVLDGNPVALPARRNSLNAICCYLETLALEQQRVLCALTVDGHPANLALPLARRGRFSRVEAESVAIDESFVLVLHTAKQQAQRATEAIESAVTLVLINPRSVAREIWWTLARQLKEPVVTLSLLPDHLCRQANGSAPLKQLRKWQLEQIAIIIREVEETSRTGDAIQLSDALENRVLPWVQNLLGLINLWHETVAAGVRLGIQKAAH